MAWTAPRTWVTGELVTAALFNTHIKDNESYLKTEVDKIDDISHTEPGRALDTIYQNGSSFRIVTVSIGGTVSGTISILCDANATPTDVIAKFSPQVTIYGIATFIVRPSWYYELQVDLGTLTITEWHEWDLH